jgi:hypothetical protein
MANRRQIKGVLNASSGAKCPRAIKQTMSNMHHIGVVLISRRIVRLVRNDQPVSASISIISDSQLLAQRLPSRW